MEILSVFILNLHLWENMQVGMDISSWQKNFKDFEIWNGTQSWGDGRLFEANNYW